MLKKPNFTKEHLLNVQCEQIEEKINELRIIKDNFEFIEKSFRREIAFKNMKYFSNAKNSPLNLPRGQNLSELINRLVTSIKLENQN
tara:strand:+ start:3128 stop:3388 length:261 start_codon:yes stop_codon:yes gene_type:complete